MRYVTVYDLRDSSLPLSANMCGVYYYLAIRKNHRTNLIKTTRKMASEELGITISAFRHAVSALQHAGLLAVREANQKGCVIEVFTDLHVKPVENKPTGTITDPLPHLRANSEKLEKTLQKKPGTLHVYFEPFSELQFLRGHSWTTERDLLAHFCNWYIKSEKTDYAKRINSAAPQQAEQAQRSAALESVQAQRDEVRREWEKAVREAREAKNEAFLQNPRTIAAIRRYSL